MLHGERALELQLEHTHAPLGQDPVELRAECPVATPGDVRHVLEEFPRLYAALELVAGQEPVLVPVDLSRALRSRRGRHGDLEHGYPLHELAYQRSLPRAGRAGDDEDGPRGRHWRGCYCRKPRGREADAFRGFRATRIRTSGFWSCPRVTSGG